MTRMLLLVAAFCAYALGSPLRSRQTQESRPLLKDFDALGAWYNGVANINKTSIPRQPNTTIAIVGAGISGLTTALMLDSVGVHNWELIEASDRVGGRFRTKFIAGTQEWVEMGPMRLPHRITYNDNTTQTFTEHHLVFQLADWLNDMNHNDSRWKIDFIPFVLNSPNQLLASGTKRTADGRIPTRADIIAHPELAAPPPLTSAEYNITKQKINGITMNETTIRLMQKDIWQAHKNAMDQGLDDYSQQAMMRDVFMASENVTDAIRTSKSYDTFWMEMIHNSNLAQDGSPGTFGNTEFKCIDQGFDKLGDAFIPLVSDRLHYQRKVTKLEAIQGAGNSTKTRLTWSSGSGLDTIPQSKEYDYTIMTVPFTLTRFMELPTFSSVLSRAIGETGLRFYSACKVALLFRERFWEQGERPIFGGYSTPANKAVSQLYYPTYGFNETGRPGAILHYTDGDWSDRLVSLTDEEHVKTVLDAIVSLHGEQARDLYTGDFERQCWLRDEYDATAWCQPAVEQHKLYIPSYSQTEHNTIFIGEHTAPTHAWVSSALQSSVRGAVQLLLEIGMVDEAKTLNQRWMGQWIQ